MGRGLTAVSAAVAGCGQRSVRSATMPWVLWVVVTSGTKQTIRESGDPDRHAGQGADVPPEDIEDEVGEAVAGRYGGSDEFVHLVAAADALLGDEADAGGEELVLDDVGIERVPSPGDDVVVVAEGDQPVVPTSVTSAGSSAWPG
jgi:hypothetical protein